MRYRKVEDDKVYRLFYPSVPAILSASHRATTSAMPVVSSISLSNKPPTIGVSSSPSHSTYATVLAAGCFSLCWLSKKDARAVENLALYSGKVSEDKLTLAGLKHHQGKALTVPVIGSAVAALECRLVNTLDFGDHQLLVGRVEAAYAIADFKEYWEYRDYRPILYRGWRDGPGLFTG